MGCLQLCKKESWGVMGKLGGCSCAYSRDLYKGAGYLEDVKWNWGAVGKWGPKKRRVVLCLVCVVIVCLDSRVLKTEPGNKILFSRGGMLFGVYYFLGPRIFDHAQVNRARSINCNEMNWSWSDHNGFSLYLFI